MRIRSLLLWIAVVTVGLTVGWFIPSALQYTNWPVWQTLRYRSDVTREISTASTRSWAHPDLYHRHPGEHCAQGYLLIPRSFTRGKQSWDGCWDGQVAGSQTPVRIDFLLPDEEAAIGAVVQERTRP